ncbi:unnamed protein product, partial [marine sediment metagenome]
MALKNFIKAGYYSQIGEITLNLIQKEIRFDLVTFNKKEEGIKVISPISFRVSKQEEIGKHLASLETDFPTAPKYPTLCSDREALVPMWTAESTQAERDNYNETRSQWESDTTDYNENLEALKLNASEDSLTDNIFEYYFSDKLLFKTSNPIACAYKFI